MNSSCAKPCTAIGLALLFAWVGGDEAEACACCIEPGTRREAFEALTKANLDILNSVKFGKVAWLATTITSPDDIAGIKSDVDRYSLEVTQCGGQQSDSDRLAGAVEQACDSWTLGFKNMEGGGGSLTLNFPPAFERFEVDYSVVPGINDQADADAQAFGRTTLFKEWRLTGSIQSGDGIFERAVLGRANFKLILQGQGNGCPDVSQFTRWQIMVTGPQAHSSFWGRLR